ncbi:hypothetical protein COC46_17255 [Bacillus sp. AFS041924]|nr:hypothetical protein COC46_17255 [Bacillus sp. AFS041924]
MDIMHKVVNFVDKILLLVDILISLVDITVKSVDKIPNLIWIRVQTMYIAKEDNNIRQKHKKTTRKINYRVEILHFMEAIIKNVVLLRNYFK